MADYIEKELDGRLDLLFAESLGCGPAVFLKASPNIRIGRMILSGPEYLDFGVLNRLILKVMPQKQYRTAHEKYMPAWALRFMGQTEEREGHMKKALKILRQAYPKLTTRCFPGYGHGDANHLNLPSPSTRSSATASITTSWVRTSRRCWRACGCGKRAACSCCMTI